MNNNSLAFLALCNEYCAAIENCTASDTRGFVGQMLRLLPRLYITASDLSVEAMADGYLDHALSEEQYEEIRQKISAVMGKDDTFLEVFEEDMKYSDTPIAVSVSELLADLFQAFYDLLETVRDATDEVVQMALSAAKDDFADYWSQTLCNVLRPLNNVYYLGL